MKINFTFEGNDKKVLAVLAGIIAIVVVAVIAVPKVQEQRQRAHQIEMDKQHLLEAQRKGAEIDERFFGKRGNITAGPDNRYDVDINYKIEVFGQRIGRAIADRYSHKALYNAYEAQYEKMQDEALSILQAKYPGFKTKDGRDYTDPEAFQEMREFTQKLELKYKLMVLMLAEELANNLPDEKGYNDRVPRDAFQYAVKNVDGMLPELVNYPNISPETRALLDWKP